MRRLLAAGLVCLSAFLAARADALWYDKRANWAIGRSPDADVVVLRAVDELKRALEQCSGGAFSVVNGIAPGRGTIYVGTKDDKLLQKHLAKLGLTDTEDEQVAIHLKGKQLIIAGNSPVAALHGVYAFLYRYVGVRYLWMGEDGMFFPRTKTFELPKDFSWHHQPKIRWRGFHLCGDWYRADDFREWMSRNCCNIHGHPGSCKPEYLGYRADGGGHILAIYDKQPFEDHPEWFCYINNKRSRQNLCFSNRECAAFVAERLSDRLGRMPEAMLYFNMFAADNIEFCECHNCKERSNSTNLFQFHQWVSEYLHKMHPNRRLAGLAYSEYLQPPKCRLDLCEMIQIATHNKCNNHLIGDKSCPWNVKLTKLFENWKAWNQEFGSNKMRFGEYGYEFDVYLDKGLAQFTPTFTLIEDSVRTSVKYDHFLVVPEVPLSPKEGPAIEVGGVVNRLPIAYYAQAMWDPSLSADAFLKDTAKTVWGPAAEPMYQYFRLLDKAWMGVRTHTLILKNPLDIAGAFLRPETDKAARGFLAQADALIAAAPKDAQGKFPTFDPERAKAALDFERALLGRWEGYSGIQHGERPRVELVSVSADNLPEGEAKHLVKTGGQEAKMSVRSGWNPSTRELVFVWEGLSKDKLKGEMHLDVALMPGTSGAKYVFTTRGPGYNSASRVSETGVRDDRWKPKWSTQFEEKRVIMRIPLELVDKTLVAGQSVSGIFTAGLKRGTNDATFPQAAVDTGAILQLTNRTEADRPAVIWLGSPSREGGMKNKIVDDAARHGWKAVVTDNENEFREALKTAELIWVRHPEKEACLSESSWKGIRRKVKDFGVTFGCSSFWRIPLGEKFGDDSFDLKWVNNEAQAAGARKFDKVADGPWGTTPYPIAEALRKGISACYTQEPVKPDKWEILATQFHARDGYPSPPCVMMRRLGKGKVVVFGLANSLDCMGLLTNIAKLPAGKSP